MTEALARLEEARLKVAGLIERFQRNRDRYQASAYNEEMCRAEFIAPLFEALGWDVSNRDNHAEQYKDVVHEEAIKVGDKTKAPDYTFRIGGVRKFFVEAKKPSVNLKSDPAPAYQLRRYAWSAKLPLSILTDFEEFAVYDTRLRPKASDKADVARTLYLSRDGLVDRFEEVWTRFSKEAVLQGSFDRYAEENKGKRGTSEVDAEFLRELEVWREELARNFALRNASLSEEELNFAVQATIDRIIFLRIAEGRGAEPYETLLNLASGPDIYSRLVATYRKSDARYNSGLFDLKSDRLTTRLRLDDKVLKKILQNLYYPQSPYEFSVLPAEILGNVYEQFLGKVISLVGGHRAHVEPKPEVKKAGGVYYTPAYIVDYIVTRTIGALCEGKTPKQMAKVRVLDPACGSGSFLLRAYQELLDQNLRWYREHQPRRYSAEVYRGPGGEWRLTAAERKRILLSSIYGVDIDRQAVEVTKLSLLLKVLEGENDETLTQNSLFGERALPSLEANIRCGNSLVSGDLLRLDLFEDEALLKRANPFDWKSEFPRIMAAGGFDVVIGNPPYAYRNATETALRPYYSDRYRSTQGNFDLYKFFLERSLDLVVPEGRVGMIVSASFLVQPSFSRLREILLEHSIDLLAPLGPGAFSKATVDTAIILLRRVPVRSGRSLTVVAPRRPLLLASTAEYRVTQNRFRRNRSSVMDYRLDDGAAKLVDRLHAILPPIETGFEFGVGINTGFIRAELVSETKKNAKYHAMVPGTGISRFGRVRTAGWILYDPDYVRSRGKLGRSLPPSEYFEREKILVVRTRNLALPIRLVATIDRSASYNLNRLSNIIARDGYSLSGLLGVLNSSVFNWLFSTRYFDYEIKPVYLRLCPMPDVNDNRLIRTTEALLKSTTSLESASTPASRERLSRDGVLLQKALDEVVEKLFGLTSSQRVMIDPYRIGEGALLSGSAQEDDPEEESGDED